MVASHFSPRGSWASGQVAKFWMNDHCEGCGGLPTCLPFPQTRVKISHDCTVPSKWPGIAIRCGTGSSRHPGPRPLAIGARASLREPSSMDFLLTKRPSGNVALCTHAVWEGTPQAVPLMVAFLPNHCPPPEHFC